MMIRDTIRTELASFRTKEMKAELKKTKVIIFSRDQNHDVCGAESLNLSFWMGHTGEGCDVFYYYNRQSFFFGCV